MSDNPGPFNRRSLLWALTAPCALVARRLRAVCSRPAGYNKSPPVRAGSLRVLAIGWFNYWAGRSLPRLLAFPVGLYGGGDSQLFHGKLSVLALSRCVSAFHAAAQLVG